VIGSSSHPLEIVFTIMFCARCFQKPADQKKDDGEWIQPITTKNKRHISKAEPEPPRPNRATVRWEKLRDHVIDDKQQYRVRWSDVAGRVTAEDNPQRGDSSSSSADNDGRTKGRGNSDLSMGSEVPDDSISRGLGGLARHDSYEEENSISDIEALASVPRYGLESGHVGEFGSRSMPSLMSSGEREFGGNSTESSRSMDNVLSSGLSPSKRRGARKTMAALKNRMTLSNKTRMNMFRETPPSDVGGMKNLFKRTAQNETTLLSSAEEPKLPAITSLAALSDGFFLTASRSGDRAIKMHRAVGEGEVELVREFNGHKSGVVALVTLDKKGRFLSAGMDKTVRLWDSRFNIEVDPDEGEGGHQEPVVLLATFDCFERLIYSIQMLEEGSFVRPTDNIDMAMITAMAKKTALDGAASVQRAAIQREIIECSGSFATLSRNDKTIKLWDMCVADKKEACSNENCAQIKLAHQLEHETSIGAMAGSNDIMLAGDIMGVVIMWNRAKPNSFRRSWGKDNYNWTKTHKFTPWKAGALNTPAEISKQSVVSLCVLGSGAFVSGTKNGTIRVWDNIEHVKEYEVYKKKNAHSMKVTSEMVSGIQTLPPFNDPNTGEECVAFSVGSTDGHVMSMALYPRDPFKKKEDELVIFHVYDNKPDDDHSKKAMAVESIAVLGTIGDPVVVAGDGVGGIKTLTPSWTSVAIS